MNAGTPDGSNAHTNDNTQDVANRAPSNLDLDAPATPYLDSNELIINMGRSIRRRTACCASS